LKPCPHCSESIQDAAVKCRYCRNMLAHPVQTDIKPTTSIRPDARPSRPSSAQSRSASVIGGVLILWVLILCAFFHGISGNQSVSPTTAANVSLQPAPTPAPTRQAPPPVKQKKTISPKEPGEVYSLAAKSTLVAYFSAISCNKFTAAYGMRTLRTRKGFSLEDFKQSWSDNVLVEVLQAETVKQSKSSVTLKVILQYTNTNTNGENVDYLYSQHFEDRTRQLPEETIVTEAGRVDFKFENGFWRYDGGELNTVPNITKDSSNWRTTAWGVDPNDSTAVAEFKRGEAYAYLYDDWPSEVLLDRKIDNRWEYQEDNFRAFRYNDLGAFRYGVKSRLEKKFARRFQEP
jgi:hypothetical protein